MKEITPTQAAYAAGLFDGEGSVWVDSYTANLSINVQVVMTKPQVVDWFHSIYGGRHWTRQDKYGTVYNWALAGAKILPFIESIERYAVLKGAQLSLAAAFAKTMSEGKGGNPVSTPTLLLRYKIAEAIGELNKRRQAPEVVTEALPPQPEELSSDRKENLQ